MMFVMMLIAQEPNNKHPNKGSTSLLVSFGIDSMLFSKAMILIVFFEANKYHIIVIAKVESGRI